MVSIQQRLRYSPGGKVAWSLLPAGAVVTIAAAMAMGWIFSFLFLHRAYYFIIVPVFGGIGLAGVMRWAVRWTCCRNRWIAGLLGLVVGLATYASYYEFCMLKALPPRVGWRFDLLPRYVLHRLKTDVVISSHDLDRKGMNNIVMNCLFCGIDLLILIGLTTGGAWRRAGWAYREEIGQWMRREKATWPAGRGPECVAAIESDALPQFVARVPAGSNQRICCRLTVEYAVPVDGATLAHPVFATLTDVPQKPARRRPNWIPATLLRQVKLEVGEVLALRPLLPELARLLEVQHPELAAVPAEITPLANAATGEDAAQIGPAPSPDGTRILTPAGKVWLGVLPLAPAVGGLLAAAFFGGGFWLLVVTQSVLVPVVAAVPGVACAIWAVYAGLICRGVLEGRWIARRLREAIGRRTDAVVNATDADVSCVSLISRAGLQSTWTLPPADVMLVKIDASRRRLLMEGDRDRYDIPGTAIMECQTQSFFHRLDNKNNSPIWMLRLVVSCPEGSRELLLRINPMRWAPSTNKRRRRATEELWRQIAALGGREATPG